MRIILNKMTLFFNKARNIVVKHPKIVQYIVIGILIIVATITSLWYVGNKWTEISSSIPCCSSEIYCSNSDLPCWESIEKEKLWLSIGFAHIWLFFSFIVSLFITGACFSKIIFAPLLPKSNFQEQDEDFRKQYINGAIIAGISLTILLVLTTIYGFALYSRKIWLLENQNSLAVMTALTIGIAVSVYFTDKVLPGLKEVLAEKYDKPIIISISLIFFVSLLLVLYGQIPIFANVFSAGAIAFQIIFANLNFDLKVYSQSYMLENFNNKQNENNQNNSM